VKTALLGQPDIEACIRTRAAVLAEFGICSVADLFFVLERIRKDPGAATPRAELCREANPFQGFCRAGRIVVIPLSDATLMNHGFVDPHTDELELDPIVFNTLAPEETLHALGLKEAAAWGWDPI
jgi:hypothetical protein